MEFTGAQALVKSLETEGVEVIFGLPGGAILPVYDPIIDSSIRHILVRHEQGAGHMAEGYAQATGRPGVAMVTSGPGATNIVTPLADAYMDSIPLVVHHRPGRDDRDRDRRLPGESTRPASRSGSPSTTGSSPTPPTSPRSSREAFHIATTGRPGPVLIDFPKDVANATHGRGTGPTASTCPGTARRRMPDPAAIAAAVELIARRRAARASTSAAAILKSERLRGARASSWS